MVKKYKPYVLPDEALVEWEELGEYQIPEEALSFLLQVAYATNGFAHEPRVLRLWWKLHLAVPDASPLCVSKLSILHFMIREIAAVYKTQRPKMIKRLKAAVQSAEPPLEIEKLRALIPPADLEPFWAFVAAHPWTSQKDADAYQQKLQRGDIPEIPLMAFRSMLLTEGIAIEIKGGKDLLEVSDEIAGGWDDYVDWGAEA